VVFTENFENITAENLGNRWTHILDITTTVMRIEKDTTTLTEGKQVLRMRGYKGSNTGGHLYKVLDEGYEKLYARFYCKFAEDAPYVHHFVSMSGKVNPPSQPGGGAGRRPSGDYSFGSAIDLVRKNPYDRNEVVNPPGAWTFYSYWCEMRSWQTPEGVPDGIKSYPYYGNMFGTEVPLRAKRGEWQCVEFMIKCNDPEERNGEQAFWIDGKLVERFGPGTIEGTWFRDIFRRAGYFNTDPKPFEGFRWRTTEDLKINIFKLQYYLANVFENDYTPEDPEIPYNDNIARVYFDNVVLATEYIGPIVSAQPPGGDYDGDGQAGISDVLWLIRLCMEEYPDASADYNRDGNCSVADPLALLLDIIS